jgi:hypothetical protein
MAIVDQNENSKDVTSETTGLVNLENLNALTIFIPGAVLIRLSRLSKTKF